MFEISPITPKSLAAEIELLLGGKLGIEANWREEEKSERRCSAGAKRKKGKTLTKINNCPLSKWKFLSRSLSLHSSLLSLSRNENEIFKKKWKWKIGAAKRQNQNLEKHYKQLHRGLLKKKNKPKPEEERTQKNSSRVGGLSMGMETRFGWHGGAELARQMMQATVGWRGRQQGGRGERERDKKN